MFVKRMIIISITMIISFFSYSALAYRKVDRIVVDLSDHRFYAYQNGRVVRSGLISGGSPGRRTVTGNFRIYHKRGSECYSNKFKSHMPYCSFFYKGFAIHGHQYVPRYHASHGCVRMYLRDAIWLYKYAPIGTPITVRH